MKRNFKKITFFVMVFAMLALIQIPFASAAPTNTIDFKVYKDGTTEVSTMDGYTIKPAGFESVGDVNYVYVTLKNSNWIKSFKVQSGTSYVDAVVYSPDTLVGGVYQRVVKFAVPDLAEKINVQTHVVVDTIPGFSYDHEYTVQFQFDEDSI